MPRKIKVWPEPLEIHDFGDLVVEVFEDGTQHRGRGSTQKNLHDVWVSKIEVWATDLLLTPNGPRKFGKELDMLESAAKFNEALQRSDLYPESDAYSSVRKRVYPRIKKQVQILTDLLP
ncbi:hypothetical protein N9H90_09950 [Pseudomonadales bacterium]|nr:hypothetical protein [Pseudomonadales bacterium]